MQDKLVTIAGKRWRWQWWRFGRGENDGDCDPPNVKRKTIRIRDSLRRTERQRRLMEVAIHEILHAAAWPIREDIVTQGAEDIADVLWKLGYRRTEQ